MFMIVLRTKNQKSPQIQHISFHESVW